MPKLRFLIIAFLASLAAAWNIHAQETEFTYSAILRDPVAAKRNTEVRAYLLGATAVVQQRYACPEGIREYLTNSDQVVDWLVAYSKRGYGAVDAKFDFSIAPVLLDMFKELKCVPRSER